MGWCRTPVRARPRTVGWLTAVFADARAVLAGRCHSGSLAGYGTGERSDGVRLKSFVHSRLIFSVLRQTLSGTLLAVVNRAVRRELANEAYTEWFKCFGSRSAIFPR